jgi:hypothetical protein
VVVGEPLGDVEVLVAFVAHPLDGAEQLVEVGLGGLVGADVLGP